MSLRDKNNFAATSTCSGVVPSLCGPYYGSALSPVDATVQLSRRVEEGADRVKTLVQDEVQSKNVTFFTARGISGEKSWDCLGRTDGRRQANLRRQRST